MAGYSKPRAEVSKEHLAKAKSGAKQTLRDIGKELDRKGIASKKGK